MGPSPLYALHGQEGTLLCLGSDGEEACEAYAQLFALPQSS